MSSVAADKLDHLIGRAAALRNFLQHVHTSPYNRHGELYGDTPALRDAVRRYSYEWMPSLIGESSRRVEQLPSLPVAWVWFLHRLDPVAYRDDCLAFAGVVIDPAPEAEVAFTYRPRGSDSEGEQASEPFRVTAAIFDSAQREGGFLWQVRWAEYGDRRYLQEAVERYLKLLKLWRIERSTLVPTYDMHLVWHAHMQHPSQYAADLQLHVGRFIGRDDSLNDRSDGSMLNAGVERTAAMWATAYPGDSWSKPHTMWRGEPPSWYWAMPLLGASEVAETGSRQQVEQAPALVDPFPPFLVVEDTSAAAGALLTDDTMESQWEAGAEAPPTVVEGIVVLDGPAVVEGIRVLEGHALPQSTGGVLPVPGTPVAMQSEHPGAASRTPASDAAMDNEARIERMRQVQQLRQQLEAGFREQRAGERGAQGTSALERAIRRLEQEAAARRTATTPESASAAGRTATRPESPLTVRRTATRPESLPTVAASNSRRNAQTHQTPAKRTRMLLLALLVPISFSLLLVVIDVVTGVPVILIGMGCLFLCVCVCVCGCRVAAAVTCKQGQPTRGGDPPEF